MRYSTSQRKLMLFLRRVFCRGWDQHTGVHSMFIQGFFNWGRGEENGGAIIQEVLSVALVWDDTIANFTDPAV